MNDDSPPFHVSELEEAWALALAAAEMRARAAGRTDISTYLALRNSNDLLRKTGCDWLQAMLTSIAAEANRAGASIQISRAEGHRFKVGHATMVGTRLRLANGVRILSVEVGWPRTPSDGFIRGGGLAFADIKHLGLKSASAQFRLVVGPSGVPCWNAQSDIAEPHQIQIHESNIRDHIAILLNNAPPHIK